MSQNHDKHDNEDFEFLPPAPEGTEKPPKKRRPRTTPADEHYGVHESESHYKIRYQRPEVAEHCARMLILNNMDYEAAVSRMLQSAAKANNLEAASDAAIIRQADILRRAPQIQKALQEKLKEIGTDDEAVKLFMSLLWNATLDRRNDKRWAPAMALLAKILGLSEKNNSTDKPVILQITGMSGILKGMGLEQTNQTVSEATSATIEDDAEDAEESIQ